MDGEHDVVFASRSFLVALVCVIVLVSLLRHTPTKNTCRRCRADRMRTRSGLPLPDLARMSLCFCCSTCRVILEELTSTCPLRVVREDVELRPDRRGRVSYAPHYCGLGAPLVLAVLARTRSACAPGRALLGRVRSHRARSGLLWPAWFDQLRRTVAIVGSRTRKSALA